MEVTGEKMVGGPFWPPILNRVKLLIRSVVILEINLIKKSQSKLKSLQVKEKLRK